MHTSFTSCKLQFHHILADGRTLWQFESFDPPDNVDGRRLGIANREGHNMLSISFPSIRASPSHRLLIASSFVFRDPRKGAGTWADTTWSDVPSLLITQNGDNLLGTSVINIGTWTSFSGSCTGSSLIFSPR
ncbi:Uncharacterized protein HZ326_11093 [Fusarium oxysporum f. sp. albedinis]|nr:Uncharacterized protein HZ326_11093 [Fusarium oxysporum f. sp. albedinis]